MIPIPSVAEKMESVLVLHSLDSPFVLSFFLFPPEEHPPVGYKKKTLASLPADAPLCYVVPGNHDWFDGLASYMRYVLGREYLGGRFLPQQKSYFALELPHDWWVFGMDDGLDGEIDSQQLVRTWPNDVIFNI